MTRCLFLLMLCAVLGLGPAAHAQIFGDEPSQALDFGGQNPQVKDLIRLQYQLQVLQKLIEHERVVNNMVKSSLDLGVAKPAIAAPDEELCQKVPANIPCAQSYDDIYDGYSVKPKEIAAAKPVAPPLPSLVADSGIPALEAAALPDQIDDHDLLPQGDTIYWTDITCMGTQCSAVITPDPANQKARYRVSLGETLPDGSIVSAISVNGVSIQRNKKTVALDPAPKA